MILIYFISFSEEVTYTSPQIQNEIIKVMALSVLRDIAKFIQE